MFRPLLFCIFLFGTYDLFQLLTAKYPSAGSNTSFISFNGIDEIKHQEGGWSVFYNTKEASFCRVCPDIDYQMSYINERGETLAFFNQDMIYDTFYQPLYKIIGTKLYYANNTFIARFRYDFALDSYVFSNKEDMILGTVIISDENYIINFTHTVDARLYKTFLVSMNYSSAPCNEFFFWNIMVLTSLIAVMIVVCICSYRKKRPQIELTQQLVPM
jgi:hypothetical protein